MNKTEIDSHYVDAISKVSFANGVFRIVLGTYETGSEVNPTVKLLIAGAQIAPLLQTLSESVKSIGEKLRESTDITMLNSDSASVSAAGVSDVEPILPRPSSNT